MKILREHLYLADLNPRHGTEAGKLRPVVVLQNDLLNEVDHPSTWIIPCTTNLTPENILRVRLPARAAGNSKECDVMVDQSRAIDNKRLKRHLGKIQKTFFDEIVEKIRIVGGI